MSSALRVLAWLENASAAVIGLALIALAGTQIVARIGFDTGFIWIDGVSRQLVLWLAVFGAVIAAREHKHLGIDVLIHRFKPENQRWIFLLTSLFAAAVCVVLTHASWTLVMLEMEMSEGSSGVPSWLKLIILPIGFGLMAFHLALSPWLKGSSSALPANSTKGVSA
jgi:TRAP-type C4-dicarboxylate transport system permease small subunit